MVDRASERERPTSTWNYVYACVGKCRIWSRNCHTFNNKKSVENFECTYMAKSLIFQLDSLQYSWHILSSLWECKRDSYRMWMCDVCVPALLVWRFFFACFKFFLRKFFFRLELVSVCSTHRRCVFACIEERIHRHVGLPCDFFIDALIFSGLPLILHSALLWPDSFFYLWLCKHHLLNIFTNVFVEKYACF